MDNQIKLTYLIYYCCMLMFTHSPENQREVNQNSQDVVNV